MGKRGLRVQPEASHERAQPLGIDVGVARGRCDTLMAQEGLHVAQVGFALVEEEGGGGMPQGLCQEDAQASCRTKDEGGPFGVAL